MEQSLIFVKFNKGNIWCLTLSSSPYNLINSCFSASISKLLIKYFFWIFFVDFFVLYSILDAYLFASVSFNLFCSSSIIFLKEYDIPYLRRRSISINFLFLFISFELFILFYNFILFNI